MPASVKPEHLSCQGIETQARSPVWCCNTDTSRFETTATWLCFLFAVIGDGMKSKKSKKTKKSRKRKASTIAADNLKYINEHENKASKRIALQLEGAD